jgi:aspartyl/asparaginyl beta-hydroxylase (cupin superfamily)
VGLTDPSNIEERAADAAAGAGRFADAAAALERLLDAEPNRAAAWVKLSAMRRAQGDLRGALAANDRALALAPLDFPALLARAFLLEQLADPGAGEAFVHAVAQQPAAANLPAGLAAAAARAGQRARDYQALVEQRMLGAVAVPLDAGERARVERFVSNSSHRTRTFPQQPSHFDFPGLPALEFHDVADFPQLAGLAAATAAIRAEFEAMMAADAAEILPYIRYPDRVPLRQWQELNHSLDWSAVHLIQNGRRVAGNADRCPATMAALALLEQPDIAGACPNAMFSLLAPGTRIPPHSGVANFRLVGHLPLIVPPGCGFRCGEQRREWREGECFVFDDTIEHEAWNEGTALRVVLIFDLWAPGLGPAERAAVESAVPAAGVGFSGAL